MVYPGPHFRLPKFRPALASMIGRRPGKIPVNLNEVGLLDRKIEVRRKKRA
jgi:hypothetical protein